MIIIGYPGIGKSTLAGRDHKYIDLESSNFKVDDERQEDWYKVYCKVAEDLSMQGYIVFVSSHSVVRETLKSSEEDVAVVYPVGTLEKRWVTKLRDRYNKTNSEKDRMAYERAKDHFNEDIASLFNYPTRHHVWLTTMAYDLESEIIRMINHNIFQGVLNISQNPDSRVKQSLLWRC